MTILAGYGSILGDKVSKDLFFAELEEILYEIVINRKGNFRFNDNSSIYNQKTENEILDVLKNQDTNALVKKFLESNGKIFIGLPEFSSSQLFKNLGSEAFTCLHFFQNGVNVAIQVEQKKWFCDDELKAPKMAYARRKYQINGEEVYLPWWLDENDIAFFLKEEGFFRGLLYWISINEKFFDNYKLSLKIIDFQDVVKDSNHFMNWCKKNLGLNPGLKTLENLKKLKVIKNEERKIPKYLQYRYEKILEFLNINKEKI
jgi:hypothetical protein